MPLALAEPVPLTLANLMTKSLIDLLGLHAYPALVTE
jgi:hypothetical protein